MAFMDGFKRITSKIGGAIKGVSNVVGGGLKKAKEIASRVKNVVKEIPVIGEDLARIGDTTVNIPIPFLGGKSVSELAQRGEEVASMGQRLGSRLENIGR